LHLSRDAASWPASTAATVVGQRVFGIALGHEDVVDHDQLRHDPVLASLRHRSSARATEPPTRAPRAARRR
jgi:hypothetical protein